MARASNSPNSSERPNLERKRHLAKSLLKAVHAGEQRGALRLTWNHPRFRGKSPQDVLQSDISLADCQQVIANESGFDSWPKLKDYVERLDVEPTGPVARFEQAVRHIIQGDTADLEHLLRQHPDLATMRSTRSHRAVLPHYIAANGVEDEHQKTPPNVVDVAEVLFAHGADAVIDATAKFYGGGSGSTPLVALVSSGHPAALGVQAKLVHVFCRFGAKPNGIDNDGLPLSSAVAFRYPAAAQALVQWGARVGDLVCAAALGRAEQVGEILQQPQSEWQPFLHPMVHVRGKMLDNHQALAEFALIFACMGGQLDIVRVLLDYGVNVNAQPHQGITALHEAAYLGNATIVRYLLDAGADASARDQQWNATPADWATEGKHEEVANMLGSS